MKELIAAAKRTALFFDENQWGVTEPKACDRHDEALHGNKARLDADLIVKNTYRTRTTRGMKGCYIYCSDEETANYFRARLSPSAGLT